MSHFEHKLATLIGNRPCALCGKPRGYGKPVIVSQHKFYHPACYRAILAMRPAHTSPALSALDAEPERA